MADPESYGSHERDIEQALIALKKGTQLVKYCRKGKPKFCSFRLSSDETKLIWISHGKEKCLKLSSVSHIIPGQRTAVFNRYLRPEKDYLSFSLIYKKGERSLDLICKDQAEVEVWFSSLKALISTGERIRHGTSDLTNDSGDSVHSSRSAPNDRPHAGTLEYASSVARGRFSFESVSHESTSSGSRSDASMPLRTSVGDGARVSVSSISHSSSVGSGSGIDDIESLGDVYVWGESDVVLDVHQIGPGVRHVALVTRQGEVFTWGEDSGGRLGHGFEKDFGRPHLVESLAVTNVSYVACGEHHTCAVSASGDLFTWGDGTHCAGLLGHGSDVSYWTPKRVSGPLEGLQVVSVACGTWHSALATSYGKLFTFGDGKFGVLGHGDRESVPYPKEVQLSSGHKTIKVACGVWHTAAIVEVTDPPSSNALSRKLFTWGDGDKYRLGHVNKETYLKPTCVAALAEYSFQQIACGYTMTVALTASGHVFTVGGTTYGQLGNPIRQPFGFTRKRHNCYHCGIVFCHPCSSKKALRAALAPTPSKPHRVCDACYTKLKGSDSSSNFNREITRPSSSISGRERFDRGEIKSSRVLLPSITEPVKYLEIRSNRPGSTHDSSSIVRAAQVPSSLQLKDVTFPSSLSSAQNLFKLVIPSSQPPTPPTPATLRPMSPYAKRPPSPPRSTSPGFSRSLVDNLKRRNDYLNQEVSKLHNKNRSLRQKSELQDMKIQELQKHIEKAMSQVGEESSKLREARVFIKSMTDKLREVAETLPPEISDDETLRTMQAQAEEFLLEEKDFESSSSPPRLEPEQQSAPDETASNSDSLKLQEQRMERNDDAAGAAPEGERSVIEQFEHGVYVTLIVLPSGSKVFKRVRFSKRRFNEQQAAEWWNQNKDRVHNKYSACAEDDSEALPSS
uniref:E3 ubiquitin-protein ligase HERC2 n=1 Tax=Cajanus cajan TaxID=3821 RepID=A0A151T1U6_CAJCA|nr:putative E3 ubiquitin-protein ligase HERC2 [Cajanus cajan]